MKGVIEINSKWHLYTSIAKSLIRLAGCYLAIANRDIVGLGIALGAAELFGILEEVGDER